MHKLSICFASLLALGVGAACGDTVVVEQGDGGGGGGGETTSSTGAGGTTTSTSTSTSTSSSGSGGMPPACQVPTEQLPPYPVAFDFLNNGPATLYLGMDCTLRYTVTSCADDYTDPLSIDAYCSVDCTTEPDTCIACEPCPFGAFGLGSGDAFEQVWQGNTYTFGENAAGCYCHNAFMAPAGKYLISVPVYTSEQAVLDDTPAWVIEQAFELPSGVVTIWLDQAFDSGS